MFTRRLLTAALLLVSVAGLTGTASAQAQVVEACAPYPVVYFGVGDQVVANVNLALRPLPNISTGRPQDVVLRGTVLTVMYGPSCSTDFMRWYVRTPDWRYGWVAVGKFSTAWLTLVGNHISSCAAEPRGSHLAWESGVVVLKETFLIPKLSSGPLMGAPGTEMANLLGTDSVYQYWELTIRDPWGYGYLTGPLGDPMLYYYC